MSLPTLDLGNGWHVWLDVSADVLVPSVLQSKRGNGYRPVSIDAYSYQADLLSGAVDRYVIVWRHDPTVTQTSWNAKFGVDKNALLAFVNAEANETPKRYPTMVGATGAWPWSPERFCVVCEPTAPSSLVFYQQGSPWLSTGVAAHRYLEDRMQWIALHKGADEVVAIYRKNASPYEVHWSPYIHANGDELIAQIQAVWSRNVWCRPAHIAVGDFNPSHPASDARYASVWHSQLIGPYAVFVTNLNPKPGELGVVALLQSAAQQGFFPFRLSAGQRGINNTRFAMILAKSDVPVERTLTVRQLPIFVGGPGSTSSFAGSLGGFGDSQAMEPPSPEETPEPSPKPLHLQTSHISVPSSIQPITTHTPVSADASAEATPPAQLALKALDDFMIDFIQTRNFRAASLAVAYQKRLVYAKAFRFAEPGYPDVTPFSAFQVQSVSKTITSTGLFRLIDQAGLIENPAVPSVHWIQPIGDVVPIRTKEGVDAWTINPYWTDVRLYYIMMHVIDWQYALNEPDLWPVYPNDPQVPPVRKRHVVNHFAGAPSVLASEPPFFQGEYFNEGYLLLGHVIEQLTLANYAEWMRQYVWEAIGVPTSDNDFHRPDISLRHPIGMPLPHEVPAEDELCANLMQALWTPGRIDPIPYAQNPFTNDAFGGWAIAPVDVVRLYASLASAPYCQAKLMSVAKRDDMWMIHPQAKLTYGGWGHAGDSDRGYVGVYSGGMCGAFHNFDLDLTAAWAVNMNNSDRYTLGGLKDGYSYMQALQAALAAGAFDGKDYWARAGINEPIAT